MKNWLNSDRFQYIRRDYTYQDVELVMPSIQSSYVSTKLANKLYKLLRNNKENKETSATFGVLDASTSGNLYAVGTLATQKPISTGDVFRVPAGDLDIDLT